MIWFTALDTTNTHKLCSNDRFVIWLARAHWLHRKLKPMSCWEFQSLMNLVVKAVAFEWEHHALFNFAIITEITNVGWLNWTKPAPDLNLPTVLLFIFWLFSYPIPRNRFSIQLLCSAYFFLELLPNCQMAWPACYLKHKSWKTLGF